MSEGLALLAVVLIWIAAQTWLLPRLGVPT